MDMRKFYLLFFLIAGNVTSLLKIATFAIDFPVWISKGKKDLSKYLLFYKINLRKSRSLLAVAAFELLVLSWWIGFGSYLKYNVISFVSAVLLYHLMPCSVALQDPVSGKYAVEEDSSLCVSGEELDDLVEQIETTSSAKSVSAAAG
jgi:hypothetical protein